MDKKHLITVFIIFQVSLFINISYSQDTIFTGIKNICAGKTDTINCSVPLVDSKTQSVVIYESYYGIQNPNVDQCVYEPGDCIEDTSLPLCTNVPSCSVFASKKQLTKCNKLSDYLHAKYYCIPTSFVTNQYMYDICKTSEINVNRGIISSPGYPTFNQQNSLCLTKITVPQGTSLNIWITDMNFLGRDGTGKCNDNYLEITDSLGPEIACGQERKIFVSKFCSNVIYIAYKAPYKPPLLNTYKGFRLYFEARPLGPGSSCTQATPSMPVETTKSPVQTTLQVSNEIASAYNEFRVCKSESKKLSFNSKYVVYIEEAYYRVSDTNVCSADYNCQDDYPLDCNLQTECTFKYNDDVTIDECSRDAATYIYGVYRFIPIVSTIRFSDGQVNGGIYKNGLIQSKSYPSYSPNANTVITLTKTGNTKGLKIYITDINIEGDMPDNCINSYVKINDNKNTKLFCGAIVNTESYIFTSCADTVTITYKTSNVQSNEYRGFNSYFEVVDNPSFCQSPVLTTAPPLTTVAGNATNDDVFNTVLTTYGEKCVFPFKYKNNFYDTCISNDDSKYWCSLTADYDLMPKKGYCSQGSTADVHFDICSGKFRNINCPKGYFISTSGAKAVATNDGSCNDQNEKCSENKFNEVGVLINSKQSYKLFGSTYLISTCSNIKSNLLAIDYICIPESIPYIGYNDICAIQEVNDNAAIIQSPNFPNNVNNINCNIKVKNSVQKIFNVYAVNFELDNSILSSNCQNSYVKINGEDALCKKRGGLIFSKCLDTDLTIQFFVGTTSYKGLKLFYEKVDVNDQNPCIIITTQSPLSTTTIITNPPPFVGLGIASDTLTENLCIGATSKRISCPNNYVISIRNFLYGFSASNKCFYIAGDCTLDTDPALLNCAGKQSCDLSYSIQFIQTTQCTRLSSYMKVDYDCIPNNYTPDSICNNDISNKKKGAIKSKSYPSYDQNSACQGQITVANDEIIKAYIIDLSINSDDSFDSLTLSDGNYANALFSGARTSVFAIETCTNKLNVKLVTRQPDDSYRGFLIYYEAIKRPVNLVCSSPTTIIPTPSTIKPSLTSPTTQTLVTPNYSGFASPIFKLVSCTTEKIGCPANYVLSIRTAEYGVKQNPQPGDCSFSGNDCFGLYGIPGVICSGAQNCTISFSPNLYSVSSCSSKKANYFYLQYQCIPIINAGNQPNREMCVTNDYTLQPGSAVIFQSPDYPKYPSQSYNCKKNITIASGYDLSVYLVNLAKFPGTAAQCINNNVKVYDDFQNFTFCGSLNYPKFLFKTDVNWVTIDFIASVSGVPQNLFNGFQLYIQSSQPVTPVTLRPGITTTPSTPRPPINLGFASPQYSLNICTGKRETITCPDKYIITVTKESLVSTGSGCDTESTYKCRQPTEDFTLECSGKNKCNFEFNEVELTNCGSKSADYIEIVYQCIPAEPITGTLRAYSCGDERIENSNGLIRSPNYPEYQLNVDNCNIAIVPQKNFGVNFYLIDLLIDDVNSNNGTENCANAYLTISDNTYCLFDQPRLVYSSVDSNEVKILYKSLNKLVNDDVKLRGFNLYFETYEINSNPNTNFVIRSTFANPYVTKINKSDKSTHLTGISLGLGIPLIAIILFVIFWLRRSNNSNGSSLGSIKFSSKNSDKSNMNDDIKSFANPNASI